MMLLPTSVLSQPVVHSVEGTLSNGEVVTISGSGLGLGPRIELFDDFENGTLGEPIRTGLHSATVGGWTRIEGNKLPRYSNLDTLSGTLAYRADMSGHWLEYAQVNFAEAINNGEELYGSWWIFLPADNRLPGEGSPANINWKQMWIQGEGGTTDDDLVIPTHLPGTWLINGNDAPYTKYVSTDWQKGRWSRFEFFSRVGYDNDGTLSFWTLDQENGHRLRSSENNVTILKNGGAWTWARLNGYGRSTDNCHPTFDDVYFASGTNARARVELGNSATWGEFNKKLSLCTPQTWSDSTIECTVRAGAFENGETVYLYVIDGGGTVGTAYGPLTFGSALPSDPFDKVPPAPPTGLRRED